MVSCFAIICTTKICRQRKIQRFRNLRRPPRITTFCALTDISGVKESEFPWIQPMFRVFSFMFNTRVEIRRGVGRDSCGKVNNNNVISNCDWKLWLDKVTNRFKNEVQSPPEPVHWVRLTRENTEVHWHEAVSGLRNRAEWRIIKRSRLMAYFVWTDESHIWGSQPIRAQDQGKLRPIRSWETVTTFLW